MSMQPAPWRYRPTGIAIRLFLTCWLIYGLHFATNIVREIYPAIALGDHFSFRLDEYAGLHPDIVEKPGFGWHINNNPGASFLAFPAYALNKPWIDFAVTRVLAKRNQNETPLYNSPWPMAREFFAKAYARGLDVKFGLSAFVMQLFCMAPLSSLGVVLMFFALRRVFLSDRTAFWLAILYAFGTPVFFRTGTLNQNLLLGYAAFAGFLALWNSGFFPQLSRAFFWAGFFGGTAVLLDYSGVVLLILLLVYGSIKYSSGAQRAPNLGINLMYFVCGSLIPLALLWFYQWKSFGNPFLPAQSHMPEINRWAGTGYHGYSGPQVDLLWSLLFDYRYGLFVSCPLLLLSLFVWKTHRIQLAKLETIFLFLFFVFLWLFFSGSNYTRLQFNTGIRYLVAIVPFLFIPAAVVLIHLPRKIILLISLLSISFSWCLAMYRDVERGSGILEPVIQIFVGGLQLPALNTLSRMSQFQEYFQFGAAPLPLFLLASLILFVIWRKT